MEGSQLKDWKWNMTTLLKCIKLIFVYDKSCIEVVQDGALTETELPLTHLLHQAGAQGSGDSVTHDVLSDEAVSHHSIELYVKIRSCLSAQMHPSTFQQSGDLSYCHMQPATTAQPVPALHCLQSSHCKKMGNTMN
jgi:hypothetical protein